MDSNDVRFPWEEPENTAGAPAPNLPSHETDTGPLAGAAPADSETEEAAADSDERDPWSGGVSDGAGSAVADPEPWAMSSDADGPVRQTLDDVSGAAGSAAGNQSAVGPRERPIAQKEYYSISEVCDLVDLKPHVLRYWETQFAVLNPSKNRSGNRVYQRKEIKLIQLVKHLLYDEKYTVEGAKQKLEQMRRGGDLRAATGRALDHQTVEMLRVELRRLADLLTPPEPA